MRFALLIVLFLFCKGAWAQTLDPQTYIHPRAVALMPTIKAETANFAPEITVPWYFPALMEHESCIHLRHTKCWNSESELRNDREQGVGLGQTTRAWDKFGKLRFDNLTFMRKKYPAHLWELSWDTYKKRPDLQIRVTTLMVMESYREFSLVPDHIERLKMADSAYNGGSSHVKKARQICQLTSNCNPNVWDKNVALHLPKSKTPDSRYGGRSMYQINTGHVTDVFKRMHKFKNFWEE